MFKPRKIQSHQLTTRNFTHRSLFKHSEKATVPNQYSIIGKSLIHQLSQEVELAVLKKGTFQTKAIEVFAIAKKCDYQTKNLLIIKLLNMYRIQRIKLTQSLHERVQEFINYLLLLIGKDQKKFIDFILMESICQSLVFIIKCYPDRKDSLMEKLRPILDKFNEVQHKMNKKMPKEQYESLALCLNYLNQTRTKKVLELKKNQSKESRPSWMSNNSKVSDSKEAVMERLKKFDETNQDAEFRERLQALSQAKKKKNYRRSGSIVQRSSKRISTTWGRQDSGNLSNGAKQPTKKSEANVGIPKFTISGTRKSLFMLNNIQAAIENFIVTQTEKPAQQVKKGEYFKSFYIYAIIKDNLRVIQIKNIEIPDKTQKLKVKLEGYFNYFIIFHKIPRVFIEAVSASTEQLKNYILAHVMLKQKLMWNVLHPVLKNSAQYEGNNKNVISELLPENQNFKFFGFLKKFNAFFFTKYESESQKSSEGTLSIYNASLEDHLESIKVKDWNKNECLVQSSVEGRATSEVLFDQRGIIISDCNIRLKTQQKRMKYSNKVRKIKEKFNKKLNPNNKLFHIVKKEQKFVVLTQFQNGKQKTYSNLVGERKYHNLFLVHNKEIGMKQFIQKEKQAIQSFVARANKRTQHETLSILNRKTNNLSHTKIRYEFTFLKKLKKLGFVTCRIFLFKPDQCELILAQAYVQHNQKYYTFVLKPSIFTEYLNLDFANCSNDNIHDCFVCLVKLIKIKKAEGNKRGSGGDLSLILEIGDIVVQGEQLISRVCYNNENYVPLIVDQYTLKDSSSSNNSDNLEIQRLSYKISKNLRNRIAQTYSIENSQVLRKYGKYNQFLKQVKQQLQQFSQISSLFIKNSKTHYYFPCRSSYFTNYITKVEADQKSIKLAKYCKSSEEKKQLFVKMDEANSDSAWEIMLKKLGRGDRKGMMKYIRRLMRDPLMARVLTQIQVCQAQ